MFRRTLPIGIAFLAVSLADAKGSDLQLVASHKQLSIELFIGNAKDS